MIIDRNMEGQSIFIIISLSFIIVVWLWDIIHTYRMAAAGDMKHQVMDICSILRNSASNPLGIFKMNSFDLIIPAGKVIDRFVIGLAVSPKYGYDIQTILDMNRGMVEVTFSVPDVQGQFGSITRLTWSVRLGLITARYYRDRLDEQVMIWEEEFHQECINGTDNETDR